jgi:hypothetical protein
VSSAPLSTPSLLSHMDKSNHREAVATELSLQLVRPIVA